MCPQWTARLCVSQGTGAEFCSKCLMTDTNDNAIGLSSRLCILRYQLDTGDATLMHAGEVIGLQKPNGRHVAAFLGC